jgi:hypothetical protein
MHKLLTVVLAAGLLSACSGRMDGRNALMQPTMAEAPRPAQQETYVWARNDGRRMANNPELYRQGQADQARCRAGATRGETLDLAVFTRCMESSGYNRRNS